MSTLTLTEPLAVPQMLFGDAGDGTVAELTRRLDSGDLPAYLDRKLHGLSGAGLGAVQEEVAAVAHGLLTLDLGDLLVMGWRKHQALRAAAERTRQAEGAAPGEVVDLATHVVGATHTTEVDVLLDDVRVATLEFVLAAEFRVQGLAALVSRGMLVGLRGGRCTASVALTAAGEPLASRQAQFTPGLVVHLRTGIPLLGETPGAPGVSQPRYAGDTSIDLRAREKTADPPGLK